MTPQDVLTISGRTLEHYNQRAEQFWEGTRDHDVSQNMAALLQAIEAEPPFTVLDFGCGPGRDLSSLVALGHIAVGLEGAPRFVAMARAHSGCEVWQQDFLRLDLPERHFDGVFANAALFHVPSRELPRILRELYATLKPGGVLFSSNPHGRNQEGWSHGRYGVFHDLETWRRYLAAAGFVELHHYYRPPGVPRAQQPWLATVWRPPGTGRSDDRAMPRRIACAASSARRCGSRARRRRGHCFVALDARGPDHRYLWRQASGPVGRAQHAQPARSARRAAAEGCRHRLEVEWVDRRLVPSGYHRV